jgi:monoterpene epsilon-lactone hydrolase
MQASLQQQRSNISRVAAAMFACCMSSFVSAQKVEATAPAGTTRVREFSLPLSPYLSSPARASMRDAIARGDAMAHMDNATLARDRVKLRRGVDTWAQGEVAALRKTHSVTLRNERWGGVPVVVVSPANARRTVDGAEPLLIELHGGGFFFGQASTMGLLDAIPVAALTGATVVAVDYRQGPEHRFPAASEDVAAVYRTALKRYAAKHIGIFGCSAGGVLTAESLSWLQKEQLPRPAAAGIFCASGDARYGGDSRYVVAAVNAVPLPNPDGTQEIMEDLYYGPDVDFRDPLVSPVFSSAVLAQFPPTLFITATRAAELSAASFTHSRLNALGVDADLHVWDGLGHAFYLDASLPESQEALHVIARFFRRHLKIAEP